MVQHFSEIRRHVRRTEDAVRRAEKAQTDDDLRDAWEDFLSHFSRALGKTITAALGDKSEQRAALRAFAHRLKNESNRDDLGLVYLRAARNSEEHGLQSSAEFQKPHVIIGGISMHPGSSISGANFIFQESGKPPIGPVHVSAAVNKYGRLTAGSVVSQPDLVTEVPVGIRLADVVPTQGPHKGKVIAPPDSIKGNTVQKGDPSDLVSVACEALTQIIDEFEAIAKVR